jgi:hypothetical protein
VNVVTETLTHRGSRERPALLHTELKLEDESFLSDEFLRQLINVGEVDILVGLPTHNNAKTIGSIVAAIQSGILQAFPRERAVIINVDGGSRDSTPELVTGVSISDVRPASNLYALRTLHSISTKYGNSPSSGVALRTILAAADLLRAKACIVMSAESANIQPQWISKLLHPIYREGFDLVTPTYRRHKFEGMLMTNLVYPMIRALYGVRIREAYPPEFAFSNRLGSSFLNQNGWKEANSADGSEMRLTLAAITGGYQIGQSFLGDKLHIERRPSDLVPALRHTVGALFSAMESHFPLWSGVSGSQPVSTSGSEQEILLEPMRVNRKRLREMFSSGVAELNSVFQSILSPSTLSELQRITRLNEEQFCYSAELWVKTVYEFAAAFQKSVISRDHIIQALAPLFRGRALTFVVENRNASADEVESKIENLCLEFERLKPYLLQMWKVRE